MADSNSTFTAADITDHELTRVFAKVHINTKSGCWEWTASLRNGYGYVSFRRDRVYTHRLMYAVFRSAIPKGVGKAIAQLDHICRNRKCCNPFHLRLISQRENILAGNGVSAIEARKTHCGYGHLLDGIGSTGKRFCTACARQWYKDRDATEERKAYKKRYARDYYIAHRAAILARVKERSDMMKSVH